MLSHAPATDVSVAPLEAVVHVALRIGRLLLVNGADTSHTQRQVTEAITSFGYKGDFFISAEALGVVAMVPGSYAFRAGIGGVELLRQGASASFQLGAESLSLIITAVLITVAIAIGLTLALSIPSEKSAYPHPS